MGDNTNWKNGAKGKKFVASFSGGKDSALALYYAMKEGEAIGLIVMMEEEGERSRSHGLKPKVLKAQAEAIGLPIYSGAATWDDYEKTFLKLLENSKKQGAKVLVTGDLDMPAQGCWNEKVTDKMEMELAMPLWKEDHKKEVEDFLNLGFISKVVTVNLDLGMKEEDLGRILTKDYIKELEGRGIDPCGEGGEFHTTVIDGPIFKNKIKVLEEKIIKNGQYRFLPLNLE